MANEYVNKVVLGSSTLIDLTADTVTADTLMQGYTAHDKSGALITGTATGGGTGGVTQDQDGYLVLDDDAPSGGGGLEYETGTWTPTEDVADYTISFANTHSTPPAYFSVVNDEYDDTLNSNLALSYVNWERMLGADIYSSSDTARSAIALYTYRSTSTTSVNNGTTIVMAGSSDAWATSTGLRAYGGNTSRYWRSTYTYKWIAVWAPTS